MTDNNKPFVSPIAATDRIVALDVLRGLAVLGILIMNIQSFSMPGSTYINPASFGYLREYNQWIWIVSHVLASEKFISIFSMLFGAGIILFSEKAIAANRKAGPLHYRRMFWLLVIGLLHAYLLWYGDILVAYSLCGMLAFVFRAKKPVTLLWISLLFFIVPILFYTACYITLPLWPEEAYKMILQSWKPDPDLIKAEVAAMQGSWSDQMAYRVPMAMFMQTQLFLMETFWRVMSMMLFGMALYRWKIFSAEYSRKTYLGIGFSGILIGTFISMVGVLLNFENEWAMRFSMFLGRHFNYIGSVFMALGYVGIVMIITKSFHMIYLRFTLAAVGRTAFSNYIIQTLICTFIFYGYGMALFGTAGRIFQSLVVVGIWLISMLASILWLKRFRYGPLEWLWRSLTYWKWQPFLK